MCPWPQGRGPSILLAASLPHSGVFQYNFTCRPGLGRCRWRGCSVLTLGQGCSSGGQQSSIPNCLCFSALLLSLDLSLIGVVGAWWGPGIWRLLCASRDCGGSRHVGAGRKCCACVCETVLRIARAASPSSGGGGCHTLALVGLHTRQVKKV